MRNLPLDKGDATSPTRACHLQHQPAGQ